jgi:hypothetical protein
MRITRGGGLQCPRLRPAIHFAGCGDLLYIKVAWNRGRFLLSKCFALVYIKVPEAFRNVEVMSRVSVF